MERLVITASDKKNVRSFRCALGRRSPDPQTPPSGQFPQPAARLSERDALPTQDMIDDTRFVLVFLAVVLVIILAAPLWVPVLV